MFLKTFKIFSAKRNLKKNLSDVDVKLSEKKIETIGLLLDETYFNEKEKLIDLLVEHGFSLDKITVLCYKDTYKKKEVINYPHYSKKDISWWGIIEKEEVKKFKKIPFDLLINFYDIKKTPLVLVTHQSKALFKVGFSNVDKKLFHFMIETRVEEYQVFINELFKYLKILKKI